MERIRISFACFLILAVFLIAGYLIAGSHWNIALIATLIYVDGVSAGILLLSVLMTYWRASALQKTIDRWEREK